MFLCHFVLRRLLFCCSFLDMAAPAALNLPFSGPAQFGREQLGQYVCWICMARPTLEVVAQAQVRTPADFSRDSFRELLVPTIAQQLPDKVQDRMEIPLERSHNGSG